MSERGLASAGRVGVRMWARTGRSARRQSTGVRGAGAGTCRQIRGNQRGGARPRCWRRHAPRRGGADAGLGRERFLRRDPGTTGLAAAASAASAAVRCGRGVVRVEDTNGVVSCEGGVSPLCSTWKVCRARPVFGLAAIATGPRVAAHTSRNSRPSAMARMPSAHGCARASDCSFSDRMPCGTPAPPWATAPDHGILTENDSRQQRVTIPVTAD